MSVEIGFRKLVIDATDTSDDVVFFGQAPAGTEYPIINIFMIDEQGTHTHDGPDTSRKTIMQVDVWAKGENGQVDLITLSDKLKKLDGFVAGFGAVRNVMLKAIRSDQNNTNPDDILYRRSYDFDVFYLTEGLDTLPGAFPIEGPRGEKGDTGPVAFTWRGNYDPQETYVGAEAVSFEGQSYVLNSETATGIAPSDVDHWSLIAVRGATGETGPQGEVGPKGDQGDKGNTGDIGPRGPIGLTGPKGDKGDTGERGPQGIQGIQGPIGLTGPKGDQGDKGDKGDPAEYPIFETQAEAEAYSAAYPGKIVWWWLT